MGGGTPAQMISLRVTHCERVLLSKRARGCATETRRAGARPRRKGAKASKEPEPAQWRWTPRGCAGLESREVCEREGEGCTELVRRVAVTSSSGRYGRGREWRVQRNEASREKKALSPCLQ